MRRRRDGCEAGGYVVLSLVFLEAGCTAYEFASSFLDCSLNWQAPSHKAECQFYAR